MALELARAYVQIVPSMQGVQGEIAKSFGAGSPVDKQATAAGKRTGGLLSKGVGGALAAVTPYAGIAAAGLGIAKLTGYVTDSVSAVANWQALNAQSAAAVKATGGAANVSAEQVNALAQSLEGQTSTQAESIQQGANLLLTFRGIRNEAGKGNDVFDQTTKVAVDMARALGTDVSSSAMQLGKALNDPAAGLTKLTRSGVTFTDEQKNQIKALQASGDTMGAQKIILAELNSEFGGSGAAYAKTYSGQLYQLQDAVGDFGEEIASAAMPALTALVGTASKVVGWAGSLDLGSKAAAGIGSVVQTIGPPIQAVFAALGPLFTTIGASLGPIAGQIGAAFAPLIPTITALAPQLLTLFTSLNPTGLLIRSLLPVLPQLAGLFATLAQTLGGSLAAVLTAIVPVVAQLAQTLVAVGTQILTAVLPVVTQLVTVFAGVFASTLTSILPIVVQLAQVLGAALGQALTVAAPLIGTLAGVLGTLVGALAPVAVMVVKLAGQLIAQLVPVFLQLVQSVLPPVLAILKSLIPVITPVIKILGTTLAAVIRALLPIVSAVFGAIVPIIRAALTIVTGVLDVVIGLLTGNFAQAWRGLGKIVSGAWDLVVGVIKGAVAIVGAAVQGVVDGAVAIFQGMVDLVSDVAGNVIQGLVDGISGGAQAVLDAIGGVVSGAVDWAKSLLGIHSPSKVFAELGKFVNAGFVKGLNGSASDVRSAISGLYDKLADIPAKSFAKKGLSKSAFTKALKEDTAELTTLAGRRDRLADQLSAAQDKLTSAKEARTGFHDQVKATTIGLGDIVDAYKTVVDARSTAASAVTDLQGKLADLASSQSSAARDADTTRAQLADVNAQIAALSSYGSDYASKIADLTGKRNDLAGDLADQMSKVADYATQTATAQSDLAKAQADATKSSTPKLLSTLQQAVTDTKSFQTVLAQLKSQGLDQTTYAQLVSAGVSGGGLAAAQEIAAAGPTVVAQISSLQGQLATAGGALGADTAHTLYDAGVQIAQASVDGIKAKIVDNQAAIALLQTAIATQVDKLGVDVPLKTRTVGAQIVAGLTDGIKGKKSDLTAVIDDLGKSAVKHLKKVLGIHSPSRVMRDEVGVQVGLGMAEGIDSTRAHVAAASARLAAIPGASSSTLAEPASAAGAGGGVTQVFTGQMGFTRDEVADGIATKARRAIAGVNIPRVRVG